ncbi:MAG: MBL fold metallo-hydrolase [Candidatus Harrisonbacteria bacterium]|nr:MBL fold metallo-hydrolase [Candidatus Harrisonbacteria bacterium]MBI2604365.1 MBL fold metallo-hydrolase [Candidatus Harrisonbacteria bacterium]
MVINWYGEGCFRVASGPLTLVSDPFESGIGLTPPRFKTDLVLKTGGYGAYASEKDAEARLVSGPGEYEAKGIEVSGYAAGAGAVYVVRMEEMRLVFLGGLSAALTPDVEEQLMGAHMLFVPAGGKPQLEVKDVAALIKKLEPRIVVASFFKIPGLKRQAGDLKDLEKALGQKIEVVEKFTTKAKDIGEGLKIIAMKV